MSAHIRKIPIDEMNILENAKKIVETTIAAALEKTVDDRLEATKFNDKSSNNEIKKTK